MVKIFSLILTLFLCVAAHAKEGNGDEKKIPYFVYEPKEINHQETAFTPINQNMPAAILYQTQDSSGSIARFSTPAANAVNYAMIGTLKEFISSSVSAVINDWRTAICKGAGNADAKVWISLDVDGKIGVGASAGGQAQSGIEIVFHCNK